MKDRKSSVRTLVLTVSAALFVVLIIAVVAFFATKDQNSTKITLPAAGTGNGDMAPESAAAEGFVAVTRDNAVKVVASLARPDAYHQILTRKTVSGRDSASATVQIWACSGVTKLSVTESGQTRNFLTDGKTAFLWYSDDASSVCTVTLPADVTTDDLSGILTYESVLTLPASAVEEAEYLQMDEFSGAPGLYLSAVQEDLQTQYWVDLSSGLLCRALCLRDGETEYELKQTRLSLLDSGDASLAEQMLLPDGKVPVFSTETVQTPPA